MVLVGIYFIAVGGALASRTVVGALNARSDGGSLDEVPIAAVGLVVGAFLMWVAKMLLMATPEAYRLGIVGAFATMAVSLVVALPIVIDGLAGLLFGGFLLALPPLSLWALYSARREFEAEGLELPDDEDRVGGSVIAICAVCHIERIDLLAAACSQMACASFRQARRGYRKEPTLLLWPDAKTLGEFDEQPGALCVVPSASHPIDYWIHGRGAVDAHGRSQRSAPRELVVNPVVREALTELGILVNKAHLVNYEDRALAIRTFQVLNKGGEPFEPAGVHAWALADGWSSYAAGRLRETAESVREGRGFRLKSSRAPAPGSLKRWRSAAKAV